MKNCLHAFTKWIICLLAVVAINDLSAQNVRDGFCDIAIDVSCGVAITNQTTVGSANNLNKYIDCNNYTFSGPEKVYKFTTTSTLNIQVDLTIAKSNLDLDILLLTNDCSAPVCVAQSISSNANTRTEQFIYNNAPAGTYYVVVDSEKDAGAFDLLVTCNATGPPPSNCNLEYTATPRHVSCGGSSGAIDVAITKGTGPFKIEWDNSSGTVWNSTTTSSSNYTIPNLPAGTYIVKVTDAKNCVKMVNGIVISNSGNNLSVNFSSTDAACGENTGFINIDVLNSSPPYWITVKGPKSGTVQGNSNNTVIKNLPPGNYEVIVEKGGCTKEGWVTIKASDNMDFVAEVSDANCSSNSGSFWITIQGGSPVYTIEWWHADGSSSWQQSSSRSFAMNHMKAGEYTIKITDKNGCWKSKKMVMGGGGSLHYAVETNNASCGGKGRAWVTISNGKAPYTVEYTGPTPGWKTTNSKSFALENLAAGNYEIVIKDANGCKKEEWFTIGSSGGNLDFELEANGVSCGEKGAIWVTIKNGSPNYTVEWWGPSTSKWASSSNKSFQLTNLHAGEYTVKITDANGCSNTKKATITSTGGLNFTLETLGVSCGKSGSIWIDIKNGKSKFSVDVTGPNGYNNWFSATSPKIQVTDLVAGTYNVQITDANGCKGTKSITIHDQGGSLDVDLEATAATCGKTGSMWVTVKNGTPKFTVELWGPNNATFWAQTNSSSFKLSELEAGQYTLKITDKNGCSITKTKTVGGGTSNMGMDLEVNNAGCTNNGRIWVTVTGGTPGYNIRWSGPTVGEANMSNTGYQINNLKAGNYTITIKDYYGCTYSKSVTVHGAGSNLSLKLESNNATCSQNGYVWADVVNGTGPYQVSYTGAKAGSFSVNSAGFQITDLPAGNYSVTVKDKNGCSVTKPLTIHTSASNIDFSLEANNGSCGQNGYVWVTIHSNNGPFQISWTGPKSGSAASSSKDYQISDLIAGVYTVTIKDKNGCQSSKNIEVKGGGLFTIISQQKNATCSQNGEIWIDINGGRAPFNINLSGPVIGNVVTTDYKYHFPNVPSGVYTIKIQDANGCIVSKQVTITDNGGSINLAVEKNDATCGNGGSAWLTASGGTAPYTFSWTGPSSGTAQSSNGGYQLANLTSGTYTVTVTDKNGCSTNKSITINNIGNNLSLSVEATAASCGQKGGIWVTVGGGVLNFNISWSGPSSGTFVASTANYRIENLTAGTYTVKVKDGAGCEVSKTVTVNDGGSNIGLALEATNATCNGKGSIWATITGGTAGFSYSWSGPVSGSTSTSAKGFRIENLPAGTYSVTVRDSKGCSATKSIVVQSIGGNLTVDLGTTTSVACEHEGTASVSIGGGTAPYTISYTGPSSGSVVSNTNNAQVSGLQPGDYVFTITDANGCSGTRKITIHNTGNDLSVNLTPSHAVCGGKGSITVGITGGLPNYEVSWNGGGVSGNLSTGNNSLVLTDLPIGTYTVTVKDGIGCSKTVTASVNGDGSNIGLKLVPQNDVCGQGGKIEVKIDGGFPNYQITWTGPISGSATSSSNVYLIDNLTAAGNYNVTVKDAKGCEVKEWVAVNTSGQVDFNLVPTASECNKSGNIVVNISSGAPNYTISWAGPSSGSQVITSNFYRIEGLTQGTYAVTVKDSKGCTKTSSAVVNANGTSLGLTLTNSNTSCGGSNGSITATVTGGQGDYKFDWTGPVTNSATTSSNTYTVNNLPNGTYTINVTDKNGCVASKSIIIINAGNALDLTVVGKNASCGQPSNIQVTIENGVPKFKIEWTGPTNGTIETNSNSYTITPVSSGEYVVRVTDASGCSKAQAVIIQSLRNDVNFTYESRAATCEKRGDIWLTIQDGVAPYNISWTGPSSGTSTSADAGVQITDLIAGVYSITVTDKNGCSITQTIEVKTEGGGTTVNFASKATPVTCNKPGNILLTMISGTAPYTVTWSGPTSGTRTASTTDIQLENLSIGNYTVNVKGAGGCGMSTRVIAIEDKKIVLAVNGTVTNGVCGGKGSIALSWAGDRDPYTVSWSGAAVGSTVTNEQSLTLNDLKDGSYTFTVTGFDGCSGQYTATINNSGTAVNADYTFAINGRKLTFGNLSSTGTYNWNFGDGATSTETNPTHTYASNGTYEICLTVTNDCGSKEKCQSVSISAATGSGSSAAVVLGDMSGPKGAVLQLPVRVENCTKLGTLSGTLRLGNEQVAQIMGLSPNAISPVYNDENKTFSYLSSGTGMTISSETILFYINVQLVGGIGQSSSVDMTSLPVALELTCTENGFSSPITPEVGSGRVSISASQSVSTQVEGNVRTYWGDGVVEAMVNIQSDEHSMQSMTSVEGDYTAEEVPMGYEYTIAPEKMSNPANGISTFGLFLTQKYILGDSPREIVSPYQVIAMDANCSGTLTTFDLYVMQQMLVGNLTEFPGCNSWVFVDASHEFPAEFTAKNVFPYPSTHTMMLDKEDAVADFIGVKVGDVLGRALPNDTEANSRGIGRNRPVMPLALDQMTAKAGEAFEVTFRATDLTEMLSFQLGLDFDVTALELVDFVANSNNELSSAIAGVDRNQLKISWYDPAGKGTTLAKGEAFFKLKFVAKKAIVNIEKTLAINKRTFTSELHLPTEEAKRFELTVNSTPATTFKVYQNTPNPFMTTTTIAIEMPQSLEAEIILHDHFGRTIQTIQQSLEKGMNQVDIARNGLSGGIYYYTVKAGDFVDTKRMLVVE